MQKKTKIILISLLCAAVVLFIAALWINHFITENAIQKTAENLKGKTFVHNYEYKVLVLTDEKNGITYRFYGSDDEFVFHEDGTLTWTRQYDRSVGDRKMTEPVSTTEGYEVVYDGNFWFYIGGLYLKLESGDILTLKFGGDEARSTYTPTSVDYSYSHRNGLSAPEALMHIDTSYISKPSSNTSNNDSSKCSRCSGTGRVTKHFGNTWNKKPGYGYGDLCGACGGTGKA